jgi:hypothetical protein
MLLARARHHLQVVWERDGYPLGVEPARIQNTTA